jgi:hypothetical protein
VVVEPVVAGSTSDAPAEPEDGAPPASGEPTSDTLDFGDADDI